MRESSNVFHLAIPCRDLDAAAEFYQKLGCQICRRYDDRITINFFGDQVVCHLAPEKIDAKPEMYPRHFGVTFQSRERFDAALAHATKERLDFFARPATRFAGKAEEHRMFFLKDPSNNLIEFKYYYDERMMY